MQFNVSPGQVVSRIVAVLILAVPIVLISQAIDSGEREYIAKLSPQDLRDYLREGQDDSFAGSYLVFGGLSLVYLGLVEGVAFLARLGMRQFGSDRSRQFAREWSH